LQEDYRTILSEFTSQAKSSIKLYVGEVLDLEVIEDSHRSTKRHIALDLYFSSRAINLIENQPFLLSKLYRLREAGTNLYRANSFEDKLNIVCQIDYQKTLELTNSNHPQPSSCYDYGDPKFEIYKQRFQQIDDELVEYREDDQDIKISFTADNGYVIKNNPTRIHWNVTRATYIEMDGIGEVPATGSKTITVLNDTIINIRASNQKQKKVKSLNINTINQLVIDYDVQFLNPASKKFCSLKQEDNNGVFGITKGNKVKLVWQVDHADEVEIKPFGSTEKRGEHIFAVNEVLEITIVAKIRHGKTKNTRIIIHEFPVSVFTQKLIAIDERFLPKIEFQVKDMRMEAYSFLREKGYLKFNDVTARLRKQTLACEQELRSMYHRHNFRSFYQTHSIADLNKLIKDRLLYYFRDKPSILSIVNRLPDSHD